MDYHIYGFNDPENVTLAIDIMFLSCLGPEI